MLHRANTFVFAYCLKKIENSKKKKNRNTLKWDEWEKVRLKLNALAPIDWLVATILHGPSNQVSLRTYQWLMCKHILHIRLLCVRVLRLEKCWSGVEWSYKGVLVLSSFFLLTYILFFILHRLMCELHFLCTWLYIWKITVFSPLFHTRHADFNSIYTLQHLYKHKHQVTFYEYILRRCVFLFCLTFM